MENRVSKFTFESWTCFQHAIFLQNDLILALYSGSNQYFATTRCARIYTSHIVTNLAPIHPLLGIDTRSSTSFQSDKLPLYMKEAREFKVSLVRVLVLLLWKTLILHQEDYITSYSDDEESIYVLAAASDALTDNIDVLHRRLSLRSFRDIQPQLRCFVIIRPQIGTIIIPFHKLWCTVMRYVSWIPSIFQNTNTITFASSL